MTKQEIEKFLMEWLSAWDDKNIVKVLSYYDDDCIFYEPVMKAPIRGKPAFKAYLQRLFGRFESNEWKPLEFFVTQTGFVFKWRAELVSSGQTYELLGLELVVLENGLIVRNEVFYDRSRLLHAE